MTPEDMQELLQWYPHTSSIQRLGFLFQELKSDRVLLDPLEKYFIGKNYFPVLLCPDKDKKPGRVDNMWKVVRNIELESDL